MKSKQPVRRKYFHELMRTQSKKKTKLAKARENAAAQVAIGFSFASYWLRECCEFSWPIKEHVK